MTTWCVRGLLLSGLALGALAPGAASAHDYPYCLQGSRWGYPGNCEFQSYEQCRASASGTIDDCGINPRFAYAQQWRGPARRPNPYQGW
jgi:Protein of unknown function (DUF3551)